MIRIAFRYNDSRWFSRLVCFVRGGDSAHCEAAYEWVDGAYGCVSSSFLDGGVRCKSIVMPAEKWRVYEIDGNAADVLSWASKHTGQGYDILGLLGFIAWWVRAASDRWFCSEAAADMMGLGAPERFDLRTLEAVCAKYGSRIQ